MKQHLFAGLFVFTAVIAGCISSTDPATDPATASKSAVTTCEATAKIMCSKIYSCLTPEQRTLNAERLGTGSSESDCVTKAKASGCVNMTTNNGCEEGQTYSASRAEACLVALEALTCEQYLSGKTKLDCEDFCE